MREVSWPKVACAMGALVVAPLVALPQARSQAVPSSVQETNDGFGQRISKQIAGHEQEPAERVFKNVHVLKTTPAARLLMIMNLGYSRALGVTCTHCHVEQDFSSDEKRPKVQPERWQPCIASSTTSSRRCRTSNQVPRDTSSTVRLAIAAPSIRWPPSIESTGGAYESQKNRKPKAGLALQRD